MSDRVAVNVRGRVHHRHKPQRRCRLSFNDVTATLEEMGVRVDERDINGWRVGRLRLQLASGIGGMGGFFVRSVGAGPEVRSRVAYTKEDIRELCRDYFPRFTLRRKVGAFGSYPAGTWILLPRRVNEQGEQVEPDRAHSWRKVVE